MCFGRPWTYWVSVKTLNQLLQAASVFFKLGWPSCSLTMFWTKTRLCRWWSTLDKQFSAIYSCTSNACEWKNNSQGPRLSTFSPKFQNRPETWRLSAVRSLWSVQWFKSTKLLKARWGLNKRLRSNSQNSSILMTPFTVLMSASKA